MRFLNLFGKDTGEKSVRVRVRNAITIRPFGEDTRSAEIGEVVTISEKTWSQCSESVELIERQQPDGTPAPKPVIIEAPKVERKEPPADILAMPKAFETAWRLSHEFACRRRELGMAMEMNSHGFGLVISGNEQVNERFKTEARAKQFLEAAERRLGEFDGMKLWRARNACNELLLQEAAGAAALIDEVREVGFAAFCVRLEPLQLARSKAESLFAGSALWVRFGRLPPPYRGEQRSLGLYATAECATYSEEPLLSIIQHYRNAAASRADAEKLLVEAKKELTIAKKAMRPAAA